MNTLSSHILRGAMAAASPTCQIHAANSYFEWVGTSGGGDHETTMKITTNQPIPCAHTSSP